MEDISNIINLELNENGPIHVTHKVNDYILNGSAENELLSAESIAFLNSSPLTEKQVLTGVNNNVQNEKPNDSVNNVGYTTGVSSNNSGENSLLSSKAENVNSSSLACEISTSIDTSTNMSCKSMQNNSDCESELNNDSDSKSAFLNSNEIPVGTVNFLPDALSDEVYCDNEKNLSINAAQGKEISTSKVENIGSSVGTEEIKDGNNLYVAVPDLVDFSFREQNVADDLVESFTGIDSLPKQAEPSLNNIEETSGNNSAVNVHENKPPTTSAELLETDFANKVSRSPSNIVEEFGISEVTENSDVLGHSNTNSPLMESTNHIKEATDNMTSDNVSIDLERSSKATEEISAIDSNDLDLSTKNEYREVSSDEAALEVPENTSSDKQDEVSPFKGEKVLLGMSDKSFEESADPESEFKVLEVLSRNSYGQLTEPDPEFKVPEVPSKDSYEQFSDPTIKAPEVPSDNLFGQFSGSDFVFKMPENPSTNEGDEQFVDAVQFFKDPNSFQFLENIRTSTVNPGPAAPRSSLYVNFDPLHSKFQTNVPRQDNCALITAAVQENNATVENFDKCSPEVVNKNLVARESLGNILISFDSPKSSLNEDSKKPMQAPTPPKMFTEEEVQQKLKIHELETQDVYIKKQREMEMEIAKRDKLLRFQRMMLEEFSEISANFIIDKRSHQEAISLEAENKELKEDLKTSAEDKRNYQEKIISLETENEKLKEDLKTSAEDLQSVENSFTDFYKRYEQCKSMLKTYKDNEEHMKQTISEQEQMYHMLQERTEEMLEKANVELDNVKRSSEAQVTVLKAQLKKAEMKISSLESDLKQIKIENSQLGGICDDLMAKVSKS